MNDYACAESGTFQVRTGMAYLKAYLKVKTKKPKISEHLAEV
jgi:hypothetical protein